jgi:hypothetical protein
MYFHTQSYTVHTEIELVSKDLNKDVVKYYVYSVHTSPSLMLTILYLKYFMTHIKTYN